MQLLFVCTGNICRSPTAERLAAAYGSEQGIADLSVSSAGTLALVGAPIHPNALRVIEDFGGDGTDFTARRLTPKIANSADLIIAMTRAHRDSVLEIAPRQLHRTFTLIEATRLVSEFGAHNVQGLAAMRPHLGQEADTDVPDPIGQDQDFFFEVGSMIAKSLRPVLRLCGPSTADTT